MTQRGDTSFDRVLAEDLFGNGPANPLMRPRQVLELATINGARVLGLDHLVGSLTPGKRADVVVVRTDQPNMLPAVGADPTYQLVQSAQPANVDTVVVDGRILKHQGRFTHVDAQAVIARAASAVTAIRDRAAQS